MEDSKVGLGSHPLGEGRHVQGLLGFTYIGCIFQALLL